MPYDEVRSQRVATACNGVEEFDVAFKPVATVHQFQHFVTGVLERNVQVLRHPRLIQQLHKLIVYLNGFKAADTDASYPAYHTHLLQQFRHTRTVIFAVASHIGTG